MSPEPAPYSRRCELSSETRFRMYRPYAQALTRPHRVCRSSQTMFGAWGIPRYPDLRSDPRRSRLPVETPGRRAAIRFSGCRRGGAAAPAVTASLTCSTAELTCSTVSLTCSTVRRVCSPSVFASRWSLWISRWSSCTSSPSSLASVTRPATSYWITRRSLASRTLRTARYMSGSTESTLKVPLMRTKVSRAVITNPSERARSRGVSLGLRSYRRPPMTGRLVGLTPLLTAKEDVPFVRAAQPPQR